MLFRSPVQPEAEQAHKTEEEEPAPKEALEATVHRDEDELVREVQSNLAELALASKAGEQDEELEHVDEHEVHEQEEHETPAITEEPKPSGLEPERDEEEDPAERRKRIAERLRQQGGFNPFSAPPPTLRKTTPPSEHDEHDEHEPRSPSSRKPTEDLPSAAEPFEVDSQAVFTSSLDDPITHAPLQVPRDDEVVDVGTFVVAPESASAVRRESTDLTSASLASPPPVPAATRPSLLDRDDHTILVS